jgi:uncharacterized protein (DUF169 family)
MTTSDTANPLSELDLAHAPVAIAFLSSAPAGLNRIDRAEAAGCSYWKRAAEGHAFYTTSADHANCPVGAFTHGAELTAEQGRQLNQLVETMVELKYLKSEEIPQIPHRTTPLQVAAYAPLAQAAFVPDLVVFRGNVRQIMLLSEAARAAGVFANATVMGRPACAMLPQALSAAAGVASVGCIGNRVYTALGDDELYLTVPGTAIERVLTELDTILRANAALEKFHRQRAATTAAQ